MVICERGSDQETLFSVGSDFETSKTEEEAGIGGVGRGNLVSQHKNPLILGQG